MSEPSLRPRASVIGPTVAVCGLVLSVGAYVVYITRSYTALERDHHALSSRVVLLEGERSQLQQARETDIVAIAELRLMMKAQADTLGEVKGDVKQILKRR